ncbi:hypothetical protein AOQ84DRAFT_376172 [Glonium stellatum]|uniref:Uncharacterized protein n=1 Tax=Glonium stellatum TaxID=574774 RepID=A0A8E2F2G0_9PEZI|nr:hypothetical protein AOQ84DRAFT_376172 [Glonium stellatum]
MTDQNEHFAQADAWDHLSSTANFCEEDYAVTQYIAEFINTLSNISYGKLFKRFVKRLGI